jgi:hypothetical protein
VRATEHAPRGPFSVLERRHGLAEIVERGTDVQAERLRVNRPGKLHHNILSYSVRIAARRGPVGRRRRRKL